MLAPEAEEVAAGTIAAEEGVSAAELTAGALGGGISGSGNELIREQSLGMKFNILKVLEQGVIGSGIGLGTAGLGGSIKEGLDISSNIIEGAISYGTAGFVAGFTSSFSSSLLEGGHNLRYDLSKGLYGGLIGMGVGALGGAIEGIAENWSEGVKDDWKASQAEYLRRNRGGSSWNQGAAYIPRSVRLAIKYGDKLGIFMGSAIDNVNEQSDIDGLKDSFFDKWVDKHPDLNLK